MTTREDPTIKITIDDITPEMVRQWLDSMSKIRIRAMTDVTTEQIGDEFGIVVRYEVKEAHVQFFAYEVEGVGDDGSKHYWRKGSNSSADSVTDINDAEVYIEGSVKWDGCSHLNFGREGYLHLCGRECFNKLATALPAIYERCGQLMAASGQNLLEGEFEVKPA